VPPPGPGAPIITDVSPGAGGKAILIDIGGVLMPSILPAAAADWGSRLGMPSGAFLGALFGGSDDQVLTGRVSEPAWWAVVAARLGTGPEVTAELRRDLTARERWDDTLVAFLRRLRGQAGTAIVSNAWPGTRRRMARAGLLDIADEIVLSCEVGYAKPDPRIYRTALRRLAAEPDAALFIDDTPGHVAAAEALGLTGHVHTSAASTMARITGFLR
jgi:putative hydrolase of the HAD superfamily